MSTAPWNQDFERYRTSIDDLPAQVVVDWNVPGAQESHPVRLLVRAGLQAPQHDGLLAASEHAALDHVIATVVEVVRDGLSAFYVGRVIHAGSVILAFYLPLAQRERVALLGLLQQELAPYTLSHDTAEDPDWTYYAEILYPDPYRRAIMSSLRTLGVLAEKGDRPELPRVLDHTALFPDGVAAQAAAKALTAAGFRVLASLPPAPRGGGDAAWALSFQNETDLIPASVDAFCRAILTAILPFAGTYDGFRSAVVRAAATRH